MQVPRQLVPLPSLESVPSIPQASQQAATLSAAPAEQLLRQLTERLSVPPPAVQPAAENHSQVMAAQAAELASARQAMQLLAQLLEAEERQQPEEIASPLDGQASVAQAHLSCAVPQSMQDALQRILAALQAQAGSQENADQEPVAPAEQVCIHSLRCCRVLPLAVSHNAIASCADYSLSAGCTLVCISRRQVWHPASCANSSKFVALAP